MQARTSAESRVVVAHDFTDLFGGGQRIAAEVAAAFGEPQFWSILGRGEVEERMGVAGRAHRLLPEWDPLVRGFRALTPAYPALVRARRLPEADLLVTVSYGFSHGFRTRNDAPQLCYCLSPLRFAWSMTDAYGRELGGGAAGRAAFRTFAGAMRAADRRAASRVTRYVAESHYVAEQIRRFYGRRADVVFPPVDVERFRPGDGAHDDYFLFCGRMIEPYKRGTVLMEAFRGLGDRRLVVAGDGPALPRLRAMAPPNVSFRGHLDDRELVPLMQRCAAVVFPSRDDFGLIPVEAMACGRPVLAYGAGGALETVVPGATGEFFDRQEADAVRDAIAGFDPDAYDPAAIRTHALGWRRERFVDELRAIACDVVTRAPVRWRP